MLGACRGEPEKRPGVDDPPTFVPPPAPPPETRVDEPSGAILMKPPTGWTWLEAGALRALDAAAVLGMRLDERCAGWVAVGEKVEPSPRPAAARVLAARRAVGSWDVQVDEDVLFANHTARRWEIQGKDAGVAVSERASFLVEGPRLFSVHARSRDDLYSRRRRCLDAVTAAFDVMPWEPPPSDP